MIGLLKLFMCLNEFDPVIPFWIDKIIIILLWIISLYYHCQDNWYPPSHLQPQNMLVFVRERGKMLVCVCAGVVCLGVGHGESVLFLFLFLFLIICNLWPILSSRLFNIYRIAKSNLCSKSFLIQHCHQYCSMSSITLTVDLQGIFFLWCLTVNSLILS